MSKVRDIKDGFGDLANDKPVEVTIDGNTLELDMYVEDLHPIMMLDGKPSKEEVADITDSLRTVLYRSYLPYWDGSRDEEMSGLNEAQQEKNDEAKEYIENLLMRHVMTLIEGIVEDLGWAEEVGMHEGGTGHATMSGGGDVDFRSDGSQ